MSPDKFTRWLNARTQEGEGGCIVWTQCCGGKGYPMAYFEGSVRNVRSIVFEQFSRLPLGKRQLIMTCRNRLCVNRYHMAAKSREEVQNKWANRSGMTMRFAACPKRRDNAPARKLTMQQAIEIRARLAEGRTHKELAEAYGVNPAAIGRIATGKSWREGPAANSSVFTWRPAA